MTDAELRAILNAEEKKLIFERRFCPDVITGQMIAMAGMREVERRNAAIESALVRVLRDNDQDAIDAAHAALARGS